MGKLTTHVLDTSSGAPASNLKIELLVEQRAQWRGLCTVVTNDDGRVDGALVEGDDFAPGVYELRFHVGDYHRRAGLADTPLFLDVVPVRFGVSNSEAHYHVPLLLSPFGYSTYRGS